MARLSSLACPLLAVAVAASPISSVLAAPHGSVAASQDAQWITPMTPNARLQSEQNTIDVFRAAAPATVFVTQNRTVRDWSMKALEVPAGSGTGFIWDKHGHIVTNYHVVDAQRSSVSYTVTLYNQKTYKARLVGGEPRKDIAVLKIDAPASELTPIRVAARAGKLEVGQKAIAIGNPYGLDHTLTTGVISALGREVAGYGGVSIRDMIQTDASINPGNSGGPLLDSAGFLIGMNTMIFSRSGASAGIGFAVPVATIRRIVPQLIQHGRVAQPGLGVTLISDDIAARVGISGVIIRQVQRGTPAAKAGLRGLSQARSGDVVLGDVIVGIGNTPVRNFDDLYNALDRHRVGEKVVVKLERGEERRKLAVEVVLIDIR